jgi:DNA-binding transcriptional regulator YiaG
MSCFSLAEEIAAHLEDEKESAASVLSNLVAWEVEQTLEDRLLHEKERAEKTSDWMPFQGSKMVNPHGAGSALSPVRVDSLAQGLLEVSEVLVNFEHFEEGHAPTRIYERADSLIGEHLGSSDELLGQIASAAVFLAVSDLRREVGDVEDEEENWEVPLLRCFEEVDYRREGGEVVEEGYRQKDEYISEALDLIVSSASDVLLDELEAESGGLTPHRIEWFLGLHDHEDAPHPSSSPNPIGSGRLMPVPGGEVTYNTVKGIIQAGRGDWTEDSLGRPVYQYTLGKGNSPWGGDVGLSIEEAVEVDMAWDLLRSSQAVDAVALHLLFLAYARNQPPRKRSDDTFRIPYRMVSRVLGLPDNWSPKDRVQHIYEQNKCLNSLRIQPRRITYDGEEKSKDITTPAQLWDTYLRGIELSNVPDSTSDFDFWIEGQEGAWAKLFLHGDHGWRPRAYLPIDVLEGVDRRNDFTRRILFHLLFLFRMGRKAEVSVQGSTLLEWCQVDPDRLNKQKEYRRRQRILGALEKLKNHGFEIDDSRLRASGIGFEDGWGGQKVHVSPLDDILRASDYIEKKGLPEARDWVWTGKRIRKLRKHIGLSQEKFGDDLPNRGGGSGINQTRVSHLETGRSSPTSRQEQKLDKLAQVHGFEG